MSAETARAVLGAEWTKLRSVPSTLWTLLPAFAVSVGIALSFGLVLRGAYDDLRPESKASFDPVGSGFNGLRLGMIALVVFGVLTVTSEYSSGTIRASLAAVPRRGLFYGGKLVTATAVAFLVSLVTVLITFGTAQAAIGSTHNASLTDEGVPRAICGAVLYMTLLSVFAMGVAAMVRSAAAALGVLVPLFFMLSEILNNIPGVRTVAQFLPDAAGGHVLRLVPREDTVLGPWTGLLVLSLWTAAAVAGGHVSMSRRDA
ncbi:ABC transporter permease subunit [Actinomadura alba]|uniref:ABC transporter permease subunit n=1 Tax=Actinomadura alba TaxID=406431 RepID=UPI001C9CFA82|nr:ABC transporter permease subunit [Actinomadura alba]